MQIAKNEADNNLQNICKSFVNLRTNLQCWVRNLQNFCKKVSSTQKQQQQNYSVGLNSMRWRC